MIPVPNVMVEKYNTELFNFYFLWRMMMINCEVKRGALVKLTTS
jgi:hypothetical protein